MWILFESCSIPNEEKEGKVTDLGPIYLSIQRLQGWGFPGGSMVKNLPANAGDAGSTSGLGGSPGRRNGSPL